MGLKTTRYIPPERTVVAPHLDRETGSLQYLVRARGTCVRCTCVTVHSNTPWLSPVLSPTKAEPREGDNQGKGSTTP
jgi:hypothetical protein